jgi:glycosyltransferase involved in cell wall biosynthesis
MSKPKVIVVNLSTSGSRIGGAAIAAEWHSRYMAAHYQVELWRMWDETSTFKIDDLVIRNFESRTKLGSIEKFLPRQLKILLLESPFLDELLQQSPDIIHLQNPLPVWFFEKIVVKAQAAGIKVVASTHGFVEIFNHYGLTNPIQKLIWHQIFIKPILRSFPYIDAIISGYPQEKSALCSFGLLAEKVHLVPNGLNPFYLETSTLQERQSVLEKYNISADKPILLFIGNHTFNKGISTVLEVASRISQKVSIVIGGKLLDPEEPQRRKQETSLAPHVDLIFTDFLSLEDQRALYHLSAMLLFPSISDTLPLTIIEAMSIGLPVVAYNIGGISFQLSENSGIVIEQGDFVNYLQSIENLLQNPHQADMISIHSQARQKKIFSWEAAALKTIEVYEKITE